MAAKKRALLAESAQRILRTQYPIESDIHRIIEALCGRDASVDDSTELEYDPKKLSQKFADALFARFFERKVEQRN